MDDKTLSHKIPAVISNMINKVRKNFGGLSVLRMGGGFLGVNIEIKDNIIQGGMIRGLLISD